MRVSSAQDPRACPGVAGLAFDYGHGCRPLDPIVLRWKQGAGGLETAVDYCDGMVTAVDGPYRVSVLLASGHFTAQNHMLGEPQANLVWTGKDWEEADRPVEPDEARVTVLDAHNIYFRPGRIAT